jgi:hypothetical protein
MILERIKINKSEMYFFVIDYDDIIVNSKVSKMIP